MAKGKFMKFINNLALTLVSVGALNWLLVALLQFDIVAQIFGGSALATWIYSGIGASGIWIGILALQKKVKLA